MKVRFRAAWGKFAIGNTLEPRSALGDWLVEQGYAERVGDTVETAMVSPGLECAMRPRPQARRGGVALWP